MDIQIAFLKDAIKRNSVHLIKKWIEEGRLSKEELKQHGELSQEQVDKMLAITPEQYQANFENGKLSEAEIRSLIQQSTLKSTALAEFHKKNIRNRAYADEKILSIVRAGEVTEHELISEGILTQAHFDDIVDRPLPPVEIGFVSWDDVPPLVPNRVDIYVLGIIGSGKSSFMAGLLYYARKKGLMQVNKPDNETGFLYANAITDAVKKGVLPPPTPRSNIQHMICDAEASDGRTIPMTFIEMSGEVFSDAYGKKGVPEQLMNYLRHENSKVLILAIDYCGDTESYTIKASQESQFDSMLQTLERMGTLQYTRAIAILITKWDMNPNQSDEAAIRFLTQDYFGLYRYCEKLRDKYNLKFSVFTYSLGTFTRRNSYQYKEADSIKIYTWLSSFMPTQTPPKSGGFISSIFGKKS